MKRQQSVEYSLFTKICAKILIVGDAGVGKTSLILRYIKGSFRKNQNVSLGVQFYSKIVKADNEELVLQIWDTAGSEIFKSITSSFYHQTNCIVIAYSNPLNINQTLEEYLQQINEHARAATMIVIARTKVDQIAISPEEKSLLDGLLSGQSRIVHWMGVSSKSGEQIDDFFQATAKTFCKKYHEDNNFKKIVRQNKDSIFLNSTLVNQRKRKSKQNCCS